MAPDANPAEATGPVSDGQNTPHMKIRDFNMLFMPSEKHRP